MDLTFWWTLRSSLRFTAKSKFIERQVNDERERERMCSMKWRRQPEDHSDRRGLPSSGTCSETEIRAGLRRDISPRVWHVSTCLSRTILSHLFFRVVIEQFRGKLKWEIFTSIAPSPRIGFCCEWTKKKVERNFSSISSSVGNRHLSLCPRVIHFPRVTISFSVSIMRENTIRVIDTARGVCSVSLHQAWWKNDVLVM